MPDFSSAIQEYVRVVSSDAVTYPTGGSWLSALCIHNGVTQPTGGSWLIAWCNYLGITEPLDGAWVIALANHYGITHPVGGTWWMALALGATPPVTACLWDTNTNTFGIETRIWSATGPCVVITPTPTPTATATPTPTPTPTATPSVDPDAQAFLTATGITDPTQESAVNQLVLDLKSASIWNKMQIVYPFVGGTATTHKYNLKDPQDTDAAYRLDFTNIIHSAAGATGNTGFADTHWIPSNQTFTNGVHWSTNVSVEGANSQYNMGIAQSGDWALINDFGTNNLDYWQASSGGYLTATTTSATGFTLGTSNGSNARALYVDGSLAASDTAGGIGGSQTISAYLFEVHAGSSPPVGQSNDTVDFVTIGEYLNSTEQLALYNAMTTFNTTLGR